MHRPQGMQPPHFNNHLKASLKALAPTPDPMTALLVRVIVLALMLLGGYWLVAQASLGGGIVRDFLYGSRLPPTRPVAEPLFLSFEFDPPSRFPVEMGESVVALVGIIVFFALLMV